MQYGIGQCQAIAKLTALLLNNPRMNVNCKIARTGNTGHSFNVISLEDGQQYIIDNTWGITRNPNRHETYLRTKSFSGCYLLIGERQIVGDSHHTHNLDGNIAENEFPRNEIQKSIQKLQEIGIKFEYGHTPPIIQQNKIYERQFDEKER